MAESDGNVSEAARRLGLHRRTLQRKLAKRPVREAQE
jgi:two-component system response regulator RegA